MASLTILEVLQFDLYIPQASQRIYTRTKKQESNKIVILLQAGHFCSTVHSETTIKMGFWWLVVVKLFLNPALYAGVTEALEQSRTLNAHTYIVSFVPKY